VAPASVGQTGSARLETTIPVRLGFVGLGNRGTSLLRTALEIPGVCVAAVADLEPRHRERAAGIARKAQRIQPAVFTLTEELLAQPDLDGIVLALPCDLHANTTLAAIESGRPTYTEKPMGLKVAECDSLLESAAAHQDLPVHVGYQRRSHPRYRAAAELVRSGGLGELVDARSSWVSSQGPILGHQGWLARRARSGDWMVEHAVHVWDLWHWMKGSLPVRAYGVGRTGCFAASDPGRDVTDEYHVTLEWHDGFHASFVQSWLDPADDRFTGVDLRLVGTEGGLDLQSGVITWRDRSRPRTTLATGNPSDTRLSIEAFTSAARAVKGGHAPPPPPISLAEAREATITGLLARQAIDERRVVERSEVALAPLT
jgi:predicted dehydrogenase